MHFTRRSWLILCEFYEISFIFAILPIVLRLVQQNYHTLYISVNDYERWLTLKGYSWKLCWFRIENRFDLWKRNKTDGKN